MATSVGETRSRRAEVTEAGALVGALVAHFAARRPVRSGSLLVTIYGDAVLPRGGVVSLATLLQLTRASGLSDGQVRTAASRLANEGWLEREMRGRHSFWRLSAHGRRRFEAAARRIYEPAAVDWDGTLHTLFLPGLSASLRDELRRELDWLGFGSLAPTVLVHPHPDRAALAEVLTRANAADAVLQVVGTAGSNGAALRRLVSEGWSLEGLATGYRGFIGLFASLRDGLRSGMAIQPLDALRARILLVHEFRRVVLRDPGLPRAMLPDGWSGGAAFALCRELYGALLPASEAWIADHLRTAHGRLPAASPDLYRRFGGVGGPANCVTEKT